MKLESSLKHFSPRGARIINDVKETSPERLTGTDVMAAIGTTSCRTRFGLAAFFGKAGLSKSDEQLAVQVLARYAMDTAPKNVRKAAGSEFGWCMLVLDNSPLLNIPDRLLLVWHAPNVVVLGEWNASSLHVRFHTHGVKHHIGPVDPALFDRQTGRNGQR